MSKIYSLFCLLVITFFSIELNAQSAKYLIESGLNSTGFDKIENSLFKYQSGSYELQNFQSDRSYPPFFSAFDLRANVFYPESNFEAVETKTVYPGQGPGDGSFSISTFDKTYIKRGDNWLAISSSSFGSDLNLNPIAVLYDWKSSKDIEISDRKIFRDFEREVLKRNTEKGYEYLFLDTETNLPVKYEKREKHYLWGSVKIEYVYSTWVIADSVLYPAASFKIVDGEVVASKTHGDMKLVNKEHQDSQSIPKNAYELPSANNIEQPKAVKVSDNLYLLQNRAYTTSVYVTGNTIYLLDATQSEERAKLDEALIKDIFPDKKSIVLVVTDLAWPHIGGVRYWVSKGANIISHEISEDFLGKVINRKWDRSPDELEKNRDEVSFSFQGIKNDIKIGDGNVRIIPIKGISTEGALMVYIEDQRFLWAGDYIQTLRKPTSYLMNVWGTIDKSKEVMPLKVAAQHLPLTDWSAVTKVIQSAPTNYKASSISE